MNYTELNIKISYRSCGANDIASSFLIPALKCTKSYKRSVGFFSSGVFGAIMDGVVALARNHGTIQLIASPKLSEDDILAIEDGYNKREEIYKQKASMGFEESINELSDEKLQLLSTLIANRVLDIKIAVTETSGDYHDKLGIMEDFDGNIIVFYGSANSSINGYRNNYEKVRLVKSWIVGDMDSINDEIEEFDSLWNNTNPYVEVYDFRKSAEAKVFEVIEKRKKSAGLSEPINLRDYQKEAIDAWVKNDYHGFYVMATGTGKTWTALYSAKKLLENHPATIVICAPYKHLIKQWQEDIVKIFPKGKIILVSSENPQWQQGLAHEIIRKRYEPNSQLIIVSTIKSFSLDRFNNTISQLGGEKLLIVDEAHRFTNRPDGLKNFYQYMLGLSATPFSGLSAQKGKELMDYFGGEVYELSIEDALGRHFLVPYYYYPIVVSATEEEEKRFTYLSRKVSNCFKDGICTKPDAIGKLLRDRLRVIAMAEEKVDKLDSLVKQINEKDHIVVYCGDGRLFDLNKQEEIRHIQRVKQVLTDNEYKASQFTATENMGERMQLVESFNKGDITALAAIRCLDEGINIPSIKSAMILASNDDYREFVQRRGRILRKYDAGGKEYATIYDVVVLPSSDMQGWAKIELRRFYEYAKLSINWDLLEPNLQAQLSYYNLRIDDVDVYDYEDMMEDESDE